MSEQAPAGWYPDGSGDERYWDGSAWTAHVRSSAPPASAPPAPAGAVAVVVATSESDEGTGMFAKLGSAVKQVAADKKATKEEEAREHQERALEAGRLVTSGVFGTATIEIYEGGYVRIAGGEERERASQISKKTPYERLRSISFASPDAENSVNAAPGSPIEGAVMQAMSGIMKGGKLLAKGTAIGLATSGVAQLAANAARKSNLVIATDKKIHTLVNQKSNGFMNVSQKEHNAVAMALVEAGNSVLGVSAEPDHEIAVEAVAVAAALPAAPTLSDRLRELSALHREGILSDDEFSAAKGKLLAGL